MRRKDAKINVSPVKCEILTTLLAASPPMFVFFLPMWKKSKIMLHCVQEKYIWFISIYTWLKISESVEAKYETTQSMKWHKPCLAHNPALRILKCVIKINILYNDKWHISLKRNHCRHISNSLHKHAQIFTKLVNQCWQYSSWTASNKVLRCIITTNTCRCHSTSSDFTRFLLGATDI